MSGKTVSVESLQAACSALDRYVQNVRASVVNLNRNAQDCYDNMQGDVLSTKAVEMLKDELLKIDSALNNADMIRNGIQAKIREIEETKQIIGGGD